MLGGAAGEAPFFAAVPTFARVWLRRFEAPFLGRGGGGWGFANCVRLLLHHLRFGFGTFSLWICLYSLVGGGSGVRICFVLTGELLHPDVDRVSVARCVFAKELSFLSTFQKCRGVKGFKVSFGFGGQEFGI